MGPKLLLGMQHAVRCISVCAKTLGINDECESFDMAADGLCTMPSAGMYTVGHVTKAMRKERTTCQGPGSTTW